MEGWVAKDEDLQSQAPSADTDVETLADNDDADASGDEEAIDDGDAAADGAEDVESESEDAEVEAAKRAQKAESVGSLVKETLRRYTGDA